MKRHFIFAVVGLVFSFLAPTSWGLTIGAPTVEVGMLDIFVHASTKNELPNSSPASEEAWIESVLGFSVDYMQYGNNVPITATNEDPTAFAWELAQAESDYFLVKNAAFWAIYQNVGELGYAVVDADSGLLPDKMNFGNATIRHYGLVNGRDCQSPNCITPPNDVPVPSPLVLIAIGLFALARSRRLMS